MLRTAIVGLGRRGRALVGSVQGQSDEIRQVRVGGAVISCELDGKQDVATASGVVSGFFGGSATSAVVVFALPSGQGQQVPPPTGMPWRGPLGFLHRGSDLANWLATFGAM